MPEINCPACHGTDTSEIRKFTPADSANHLVPPRRSPERNSQLSDALTRLWGRGGVRIRQCATCAFGFADPFVAGSPEVYNIFGGGAQHYPRDRFEFAVTTDALRARGGVGRLLEIGAGSGSFLKQLQSQGLAREATATEYDDSAVAALRSLGGVEVYQGDFRDHADEMGTFDAICMFQVLEHLDRLDEAFSTLRSMLRAGGSVFVGVPNSERTYVQEDLTRFMDMPPVHIGRWTDDAVRAIAQRHGLALSDVKVNPPRAIKELALLANYRLEQRTRDPQTRVSRVEAIQFRPARGVLKRAAAVWDMAVLAKHYGTIPPATRWFHLQVAAE